MKKKRVFVLLPHTRVLKEQHEWLQAKADESGNGKAAVVRDLIKAAMDKEVKK